MTEPATKKPREDAAPDGEKDVIMVTGGSGLVGQAIRMYVESNKKDNEEWIYLSSKDGDLRVRSDTDAIFAKYKPTHVIHLAAKVGGLFANLAQKVCACSAVPSFSAFIYLHYVRSSSQLLDRTWKRPVFRADPFMPYYYRAVSHAVTRCRSFLLHSDGIRWRGGPCSTALVQSKVTWHFARSCSHQSIE